MPLRPTTVTSAAQVMLPWYSIMYGVIGLLFIFQDPLRTSGESFRVARDMFPIPVWGALFLIISTVEAIALVIHRRGTYMVGLTLGAGMAGFWGGLLVASAALDNHVSFTSAMWVLGWVAAHVASTRSLARREHS